MCQYRVRCWDHCNHTSGMILHLCPQARGKTTPCAGFDENSEGSMYSATAACCSAACCEAHLTFLRDDLSNFAKVLDRMEKNKNSNSFLKGRQREAVEEKTKLLEKAEAFHEQTCKAARNSGEGTRREGSVWRRGGIVDAQGVATYVGEVGVIRDGPPLSHDVSLGSDDGWRRSNFWGKLSET